MNVGPASPPSPPPLPRGRAKAAAAVPPPPPPSFCGETLDCCPTHRAASELLEALKEVNRDGLGSRFFQGTPRLLELLVRAQGGRP